MDDYERIARIIRHIDSSFLSQPGPDELAAAAGLSQSHFHRLFAKWAGITPKDFIRSLTMNHAHELLRGGSNVLAASLEAGLSGPGRLHDLCVSLEGATPGEIRSGGAGLEVRWGIAESPFGKTFLARTPKGLSHLSFFDEDPGESIEAMRGDWPAADLVEDHALATELATRIFSPEAGKPLRLHPVGTAFQLKVWQALIRIPEAELTTYGQLASGIGQAKAARAVGGAVGKNRISYLIPCHRVIRETGILGGYRWGPFRKRVMIARENAVAATRR